MSVSCSYLATLTENLRTVGPHTVHVGQMVYINDTVLSTKLQSLKTKQVEGRHIDAQLRIFIDFVDAGSHTGGLVSDAIFTASTGLFAGDPSVPFPDDGKPLRFGQGEGVGLVRDRVNPTGCHAYTHAFADEAILVHRGGCTFLEKLQRAHEVGASGVVVINDSDETVTPSANGEDLKYVGDSLDDAAVVVLRASDGRQVSAMLDVAEDHHVGRVVLIVENLEQDPALPEQSFTGEQSEFASNRVLYINGYALLNTRLLV